MSSSTSTASTVLPVSAEESPSAETATTSTAAAASADNNNNIDNTNTESSTVKQNNNLPEYVTNIDGSVAALMEEIPIQYAKRQSGFFSSVTVTPQNKESLTKAALLALIRLFPNEHVRKKFLHKYVIARSGRIESAAERVLNFCEQLENYPHVNEINIASEHSKRLMTMGAINAFPLRLCDTMDNAFMVGLILRNINWDFIGETENMEKFWLSFIISVALMRSDHAAQINGVVLQLDLRGVGSANIRMPFQLFIMRMITHCLPVRIKQGYCYSAPSFVAYFAWPIMKNVLSTKIADRFHFVDQDKQEEIIKGIGKHNTFGVIMKSVDDKENPTTKEKKQEESSGTDEEGASSASASATAKTNDNKEKEKEEEYWFPERMPSEKCWKEILSWMQ